jgi:hydrogenase nickel incorporation protein HypA/HybF
MHELSLARNLFEQIRSIHREHPHTRISDVEIEVGSMAGVEPLLFRSAFERLTLEEGLEEIQLIMHEVPVLVHCLDCHQESVAANFEFFCSHCQGKSVRICNGDCVKLMSIDLIPVES